jgi:hypothetical protein
MRYGVVTAFLASSSVHTTFLRMLLRVPMQSDNSFSMGPPTGSQLASLLFENSVCVSLQSEFSNDQIENSALLSNGRGTEPISDQRILPWRFAACELAYIHSNFSLPLCRLLALFGPEAMSGLSLQFAG